MGMENFPSNLMNHLKQMMLLILWQAFHNKIHNKSQQNRKQNLCIQNSSGKSNFLNKIFQFYLQKKKICQIYQVVVSKLPRLVRVPYPERQIEKQEHRIWYKGPASPSLVTH